MKKSFALSFLIFLITFPFVLFASNPPVAYYTFSRGTTIVAPDYGSYAINGAVSGATPLYLGITGYTGDSIIVSAYDFDGINDKINCGTNNRGITNNVTVSVWIKTTSNSSIVSSIVSKYATNGYALLFKSGQAYFDGRDGSGAYRSSGASSFIADGNWHHLAGVEANGIWQIYVDGILSNSFSSGYASTNLQNTNQLGIGYLSSSGSNFYQGAIDEVSIYDYALTSNEISVLSMNKNLMAFYPFAGNAEDRSDLALDGTLNNPSLASGHNGIANTAYNFDGNDMISCWMNNRQVTNSVTVAAWIKTTSTLSQMIVIKYNPQGYHLYTTATTGLAAFSGRDGSGNYRTCTGKKVNDGNWHCLVGVVNNGTWELWVDGTLQFSLPTGYAFTDLTSTYPLVIGYNTATSGNYFVGQIDDVRIYNRALTATEIPKLSSFNVEAKRSSTSDPVSFNYTSIDENIGIYPNPTEDIIKIDSKGRAFNKIEVLDVYGKIILETDYSLEVSLLPLPTGMYFVLIKNETGQVLSSSKIIKK